jgi:hypothetical protein
MADITEPFQFWFHVGLMKRLVKQFLFLELLTVEQISQRGREVKRTQKIKSHERNFIFSCTR